MHPTCLPQLALPVELIERTLGFLKDDIVAINRAALTCKGLLPICRTLILSEVTVPVLDGTVPQPRRQTRFLELIDTTPLLALYVRSLTIDMPPDGVYVPLWTAVNVWEKLPNLRTLTFRRMGNGPNGNVPLRLSNLPLLETLVLDDISGSILREIARARGTPKPPSPLMHIHSGVRLRRLCITGGNFSPSLLVDLADDMLKNGTHAFLESVDLQWSYLYAEPSIRPLRAWAKIFVALGPQLRHCGLSIACDRDTPTDIRAIYASLLPCTNLRSLTIRNSRSFAPKREPIPLDADTGFAFLHQLADLLHVGRTRPVPFTHLERLQLNWTSGLDLPIPALARASAALARALAMMDEGGHRLYPVFRKLDVRAYVRMGGYGSAQDASSVETDEPLQETLRLVRETLKEGLGEVEHEGVRLEIVVEP
ncbi:hypothetical protein C8Q76DRAFT_801778 [Earliella scabrosa]|nr:hypothetical protein C8Q76DRAFT_801778 [Earliella scabrosa]